MVTRVCALAAVAAMSALLALTSPALAHPGHASCGEGAQAFIVAQAQSGTAGESASAQAREGALDENVEAGHAALCEPRP